MAAPMRPRLRGLLATPAKRYKHVKAAPEHSAARKVGLKWASAKCVTAAPDGPDGKRPFNSLQPLRLKGLFTDLPAYEKWFERKEGLQEQAKKGPLGNMSMKKARRKAVLDSEDPMTIEGVVNLNSEYLDQFGDAIVPLERTEKTRLGDVAKFDRFNAPLSLLLMHLKEWKTNRTLNNQLYLAQHALSDLPKALQDDLPVPALLKNLGNGDIYGSSLWMGIAPTFTPLHRDPNPNLFVQLSGKKKIRLMSPDMGKQLYNNVVGKLGKSGGQAHMRGEEMMQGEEFAAMESAVWNDNWENPGGVLGFEVVVKKGGGLYIPKGWWHAVRGVGKGPNVSVSHSLSDDDASLTKTLLQVNWWFR
jgi:hypothetical protein